MDKNIHSNKVIGIGHWLLIFLVQSVPVLNLVILLIWSFKKSTPKSKSNYAKAAIIWGIITTAIFAICVILLSLYFTDYITTHKYY